MAITIDITGFYYSADVNLGSIVTVEDAMREAEKITSPAGGKLAVSKDLNGFVNKLTVVYPPDGRPKSRQSDDPRPVGTYSYDDNPLKGGTVVSGNGNIDGQLAWQYYVSRAGMILNNDRAIIPFDKSNAGKIGPLQDGDVVTWRLVAIFGLRREMQDNIKMLEGLVADGGQLSMKSAIRALKDEG